MAIDMTQFHRVFFEETVEQLSTMESLLLYIDPQDPDPEQLDDLRRAAHSIKGSSDTFGFRDMAELAQEIETRIESVRKGSGRLSGELVLALRQACGALRTILAGHRGESAVEEDAAAYAASLLRGLADRGDGQPRAASQPAPALPPLRSRKVSPQETASDAAPDADAPAGELSELAQRTAMATNEVMALLEAAGAGGLSDATEAVRRLGEAIEQNAALVERAAENADMLRESFRALVRTIAGLALSPSGGSRDASRLGRPRPLPKFRRASGKAEGDKEWPEF